MPEPLGARRNLASVVRRGHARRPRRRRRSRVQGAHRPLRILAARGLLYSWSSAYFFLKVPTAFRSSSSSTSSTLETIPVVSSKPRLQLRRQPRMRSMTVRSSAFTATSLVPGELELRTFRPMHRSEGRRPAADPEALHLDRVPARRKDDRPPCPGGRLFGTKRNTWEA